MIDFQYISTEKISTENISNWLKDVTTKEGKEIGELVYVFCNDDYLIEKNIQFLKHDTLTDVITFDYCNEEIISGDILISTERVKENALKYEVDFLTELHRVMVHGLLHLLGYQDKNEKNAKKMREKENYYLNKLIN